MNILTVDDDPHILRILNIQLERWGHSVTSAHDGQTALERLQRDAGIQLLITDWSMPRMDGLELVRAARQLVRARYLHIILLTGRGDRDDLLRGMDAGADAFLTKPFKAAELQAQIRVAARIIDLEGQLANRVAALDLARQRIERDLAAAAEIQQALLPAAPPPAPGLGFGWVYDACEQVGGDMFNVIELDERHLALYVLDVSGHGVPAALLSVSLSHAMTPLPQGGLLRRGCPDPPYITVQPPAAVARELNRRFQLMDASGHFVTLLYGVLDLERYAFCYVRAGHPGPIQLSAEGARIHDVGGGPPVGVLADLQIEEHELLLAPGDQVVLYTDGVTEACQDGEQSSGTERLAALLAAGRGVDVADTLAAVHAQIVAERPRRRRRDDVTLVGVGRSA